MIVSTIARTFERAEKIAWVVLAAACTSLASQPALNAIGRFDGKRNPVLNPSLTVISMVEGDYETTIKGDAFKVRGECEYIPGSLEWWHGTPNGPHVKIPAYFTDPPLDRGKGWTEWSGIVVSLPPETIETRSFATVKHDCGGFWDVESVFYLSPGMKV